MNLRLNSKLVLVRVDKPKEQTDNGVYMAEEWQQRPPTGTIEAVGAGVGFCKVGDHILFERYTSVPTTEEDLRICREDAIFGVYDETEG